MSQSPNSQTERPIFEYKEDEKSVEKLSRKSKESPLMIIGMSSFFLIAGYGIYKFRSRKKLSASNYLMQLRVTAQGAVIGFLGIGVLKSLYDRYQRTHSS